MCLIRIILLSLTLLNIAVAQSDRWPFCENEILNAVALGELHAFPHSIFLNLIIAAGCTTSAYDPCVRQDETCKNIFCHTLKQENVDECKKSCNENLGFKYTFAKSVLVCFCIWKKNTLCKSYNPLIVSPGEPTTDFVELIVLVTGLNEKVYLILKILG
jgi:hypothetical protein